MGLVPLPSCGVDIVRRRLLDSHHGTRRLSSGSCSTPNNVALRASMPADPLQHPLYP